MKIISYVSIFSGDETNGREKEGLNSKILLETVNPWLYLHYEHLYMVCYFILIIISIVSLAYSFFLKYLFKLYFNTNFKFLGAKISRKFYLNTKFQHFF